jgi:hypothetical protein
MGFTQLFIGLLMAIGAVHLVFSTVAAVDRWLLKDNRSFEIVTKNKKLVGRFSWYVFFNPDDLCGKQTPTGRKQPLRYNNMNRNQQQPRPRMTARF